MFLQEFADDRLHLFPELRRQVVGIEGPCQKIGIHLFLRKDILSGNLPENNLFIVPDIGVFQILPGFLQHSLLEAFIHGVEHLLLFLCGEIGRPAAAFPLPGLFIQMIDHTGRIVVIRKSLLQSFRALLLRRLFRLWRIGLFRCRLCFLFSSCNFFTAPGNGCRSGIRCNLCRLRLLSASCHHARSEYRRKNKTFFPHRHSSSLLQKERTIRTKLFRGPLF